MSNTAPEQPTNWELSRSITRIESSIEGVGARLEAKIDGLPSKSDFVNLERRIEKLENGNDKRLDRVFSVWLALGLTFLTALLAVVVPLVTK